ncbi:MAG: dephospho-CoA kinase [Sinobacteraceae bacterium]|nr:dephospho-CoA kinase [Nevskiaceae bacterium]
MLRIGLTGGIASGKSTVERLFAAHGVPIIDSDVIAREVVAPGTPGLAQVRARFGDGVLQEDGSLDRRALRRLVFEDPMARRDLEAILHPLIRSAMAEQSAAANGPYQINVIPLLIEGGRRAGIDRVLVVDCPEALQIERVMQRDQVTETEARAVLAAQTRRSDRLAAADDVIVNDGDPAALQAQVDALHAKYLHWAVYGHKDPATE